MSSHESYADPATTSIADTNGDGDSELSIDGAHKPIALTAYLKTDKTAVTIASPQKILISFERSVKDAHACGGGYIKVYDETVVPSAVTPSSPYLIMFGPDKCGYSTNKVHFIVRYKNPKTGVTNEHHLTAPPPAPTDTKTHLFTVVIDPSKDSYALSVDGEVKKEGALSADFTPPFIPSAEIDDPEDKKPADWVDAAKIPDETAVKPEDWDESAPRMIDDENATKPEDWLDNEPAKIADPKAEIPADWNADEDGSWVAPQIDNPACAGGKCGEWKRPQKANPAYKGKWIKPMVDNPAYKGVWAPRKVANPAFFETATLGADIFYGKQIGSFGPEVQNTPQAFDDFVVVVAEDVTADLAKVKATFAVAQEHEKKTPTPSPSPSAAPAADAEGSKEL